MKRKINNYWHIKPLHFNIDSDHDGVLDHDDCRPFDYRKQDEFPSIEVKTENSIYKLTYFPFSKLFSLKKTDGYYAPSAITLDETQLGVPKVVYANNNHYLVLNRSDGGGYRTSALWNGREVEKFIKKYEGTTI